MATPKTLILYNINNMPTEEQQKESINKINNTNKLLPKFDLFNEALLKEKSIDFAKFRDVYKRRESNYMHIKHTILGGGIVTWMGSTDESIYDLYLKGEQYEDPYETFREQLKEHWNKDNH